MLDVLNEHLKDVEVREPIKTLFNPSFKFQQSYEPYAMRLSVYIDTIEAVHGTPLLGLESNFNITPYLAERYARDPLKMAQFVVNCLSEALRHEVQESILYQGKLALQPEHWGPDST